MNDVKELEQRIMNLQGIATPDEYETMGEAAIEYGTYDELPSNVQNLIINLENRKD